MSKQKQTHQEELEESKAPFMEHLEELRARIWRSLIGLLLSAILCGIFYEELFFFITGPLFDSLRKHELQTAVKFRTVTGAFLFHFKTAILAGVFLSIPWLLYQLWSFVAPGLYKKEQRLALPFVILSSLFFLAGGAFGYFQVLPLAFDYLMGLSIQNHASGFQMIPDITVEDYLSFTTKLLLAFGISFEMPVITAFFSAIGLLSHRSLLRYWRYAVVGAFILAAILTPPDYITQLMLAGPLLLLYGLSISIAWLITTRREKAEAA